MGPIGMPELILLFVVLPLLAITVVIVIVIVRRFSSGGTTIVPPPMRASIEDRLVEIDSLRSKNLITDAEHEEKRRQILNGI